MSDLSSELSLALAIDDDDTADYLTTNEGLRGSLLTLDGLFNASTGHAHNGSHQGGTLQFLDLTIGQNLTVNGSSTLKGSVSAQQNVIVAGTLSIGGLSTLNSLDVTTTSRLRGTVTIDGTINSGGTLTIGQDLSVGRDLSVARNASITGTLTVGAITTGGGGLTVGGSLSASGNITASGVLYGARSVIGGYDAGWALNVAGSTAGGATNPITQGFWYQRGRGDCRAWDNIDFTFAVGPTAATLVQRDGSGYVQANSVYMPTGAQSGKPTYVCGQNNDGYMRWWPTNAIGPPISTWYCQASIQLPSLSNNGASQDASFSAMAISGGFGCGGNIITVPRPGYYSIAGGFNGYNQTGNQETMDVTLISSAHGNLDYVGVPLRITSYLGGYFSWSGFLNAGETIRLNFRTSFDSISGNGEMIVAFIPTADYNN